MTFAGRESSFLPWWFSLRRLHAVFSLNKQSLGLRQPERHVHSLVQVGSSTQLGLRLCCLSHPAVQFAKAEMAMRLQRAHAELNSQRQGLLVLRFGLFEGLVTAMGVNLAEKP
jgi:hypothetical protein